VTGRDTGVGAATRETRPLGVRQEKNWAREFGRARKGGQGPGTTGCSVAQDAGNQWTRRSGVRDQGRLSVLGIGRLGSSGDWGKGN
jgi:hypothetical protein